MSERRERPILFSGPLVRAILEGRKTVTRRIVTPQPDGQPRFYEPCQDWFVEGGRWRRRCPYGVPGDRLWVRERMRVIEVRRAAAPARARGCGHEVRVRYEADSSTSLWLDYPDRLAPAVVGKCLAYGGHREASRISLEVTSVRVERLQSITEEDARAEGVQGEPLCLHEDGVGLEPITYLESFERLWGEINGKRAPWASNPLVWVVSFRRLDDAR